MYEHRVARPVARTAFLRRLAGHFGVASMIVLVSLGVGMAGYRHFEEMGWRDAFLNTAMLLGGMGPIDTDLSPEGKIFAGLYALYAGLVFLVTAGIIGAPLIHRLLHQFHWEDEDGGSGER